MATDIVCQKFNSSVHWWAVLLWMKMLPLPLSHDFIRLILGESVAIDNLSQFSSTRLLVENSYETCYEYPRKMMLEFSIV